MRIIFLVFQRPSQMNLNEANGHVSGGLNTLSNVEGGLQTIQEDQEDDDSQPIEVCALLHMCIV